MAVTATRALTISGESSLKFWDTKSQDHPLIHTFADAHPLGGHHVTVDVDNGGTTAASSGFGQELVVWDLMEGKEKLRSSPAIGEAWALSLSPDGKILNTTTHNGRVILWDASSLKKISEIDTKGSFGICIACVLFKPSKLM